MMSWIRAKQGALLLLFDNAEEVPNEHVRRSAHQSRVSRAATACHIDPELHPGRCRCWKPL
jgi:hypothetical protein